MSPTESGTTSVVKVGTKSCKPFLLQVGVFSPEAGYKFEVLVERACTAENDAIWKLVFDLYRKNDAGEFDQIVHVSFRAGTEEEGAGVRRIALDGVSRKQADQLVGPVFKSAKQLEKVDAPSQELRDALRREMAKVTTIDL